MTKYLRGNMLFVLVVLAIVLGLSLPVPEVSTVVQAQEEAQITYPPEADTDYEKLVAVYSLIEQMRLEHNRQGAIARSDWKKYKDKWNLYAIRQEKFGGNTFWRKMMPLLKEQNRLRDSIKKSYFPTQESWMRLSIEEQDAWFQYMFGNKQEIVKGVNLSTKTGIVYSLFEELKGISLDSLQGILPPDPTEDFTTYTENDPNSDLTITADRITVDTMQTGAGAYVWKALSASVVDFEHLHAVSVTEGFGADAVVGWWGLSDGERTYNAMNVANNGLLIYSSGSGESFYIKDFTNDEQDVRYNTTGTWWLTIERASTIATCKIYDNVARGAGDLDDTLTITCGTNAYDDINAILSAGWGGSDTGSGYCELLDLQEAGVSAPTVVTNAATSVEETTATLSGNITATGGENADWRGFKWDIDTGEPYADNWTESGNFTVGNFTHGITGLTKGELYYSIATANNSGGWGSGSEVTLLTKPDEPNTLVATAGDEQVSLAWSKGTGAQKTYIRGKAGSYPTDRSDGYEVYNDTGTSTTDTGLSNGTTYYYRAWSFATEGGKEQYSDTYDQDSATPESGVLAPTVVTNAATSVEETTATLSGNITATGGENADWRGFEWDTDTGAPYADNWTDSGNFTVGNFTHGITGLTKGELYYSRAIAHNSGGWGSGSEVTFLTKPDEPNTLAVTDQGSAWIAVSWVKGTGTDNTTINYRTDQTPTDPDDGTISYNGTGTSANITGLSAGQIYYIGAWSQCWEGALSQSSDVSDNLTDYTLPGDPSGMVSGNVTATSIEMTWVQGTGGDFTEIRRKTGSYPTNVADGTQSYYNTGTSDNDTGLDKGSTYYYRAWARDTDSNYYSDGYTQSSNTTSTTAPTVTNNGGATNILDVSARLRGEITDTGGDNPTAYIYWGLTDGTDNVSAWTNEKNLGVETGSFYYDSSNLTASTMYFYRCKATNGQGTDWANSTANFTTEEEITAIGVPTGLTVTDLGAITLEFNWGKGTNAEYTMIRAQRSDYPEAINEGELVYYGDNVTCNVTGYSLLTTEYVFSVWGFDSDNVTHSDNSAQISIGGEDMETVADEIGALAIALGTFSAFTSETVTQVFTLFLCIAITGLAFWRNSAFLLLLAVPVDMIYGLSFAASSTPGSDAWVGGVIVAIIGISCLFKVVAEQFEKRRVKRGEN